MTQNQHPPADRLTRATFELRGAVIPAGPAPDLVAATLIALQANRAMQQPEADIRNVARRNLIGRLSRICGVAALLMLLMFGLYLLQGERRGAAFAAVLQKIEQADSVSLHQRQKLGSQTEITVSVLMQGDAVRLEFPDSQVIVYDLEKKAGVDATPFGRQIDFHQFELSDDIVGKIPNLLQALRTSRNHQAERLGAETIGGRRQEIFRLKQFHPLVSVGGQDLKLWADADTGLPSKIEVRWFDPGSQIESYIVMEDFQWNAPLAPDLFDIQRPNVDCLKPALSRESPINTARHVLPASQHEVTLRGQVLNPAGLPQPEAKIYASGMEITRTWTSPPILLATTDALGRFEAKLHLPRPEVLEHVILTATHRRWGIVGTSLKVVKQLEKISIQFVPPGDPIMGRIVAADGKAVSGAKVHLDRLTGPVKKGAATVAANLAVVEPVMTDADGRFTFQNLGAERIATLEIAGRGLERAQFQVSTSAKPQEGPKVLPPHFEFVGTAGRTIKGRVFDRESKAPIQHVQITISNARGRVVTDANGQFEFPGAPRRDKYGVMAVPFQDQPYLIGSQSVTNAEGSDPLTVELGLTRGIVFSAQVLDAETGRPVQAQVAYYPLYPNAHVQPAIGYEAAGGGGAVNEAYTFWSDSFTIAILPGPGAVCVRATETDRYSPTRVNPADFFKNNEYGQDKQSLARSNLLLTQESQVGNVAMLYQDQYHAIILVNPKPGEVLEKQEIRLQPRKPR